MVEVVNIKNVKDFGSRPGDVYIGGRYNGYKQSVWANPFPITGGRDYEYTKDGKKETFNPNGMVKVNGDPQEFTRESSIQRYIKYIINHEKVNVNGVNYNAELAHANFPELLKAKRLGCWCKPHICHGDFLKMLIDKHNQGLPTQPTPISFDMEYKKHPLKDAFLKAPSLKVPPNGFGIEYSEYIKRSDLQRTRVYNESSRSFGEPNKIFVFGDNDQRTGFGGQAKEMRGEPNAIGIRVKKSPSMDSGSFYTDDEYESNARKIAEDLEHLYKVALGKVIVFPTNGIGTGMAMLNRTAPRTFAYLTFALKQMFNINNGNPQSNVYKYIDKEPSKMSKFISTLKSSDREQLERKRKSSKSKITRKPIKKVIKKSPIKKCKCKK